MESCRATDVVARYGGDEFVVLMPGTDAEGAGHVVLKVEEAIARHNAAASGPLRLSASIGVHTAGAADVADLLHEADRRMYATKRRRALRGLARGAPGARGWSRTLGAGSHSRRLSATRTAPSHPGGRRRASTVRRARTEGHRLRSDMLAARSHR